MFLCRQLGGVRARASWEARETICFPMLLASPVENGYAGCMLGEQETPTDQLCRAFVRNPSGVPKRVANCLVVCKDGATLMVKMLRKLLQSPDTIRFLNSIHQHW